jgi:DnaJ-class molecular chaperone
MICTRCGGTGRESTEWGSGRCDDCDGTGSVPSPPDYPDRDELR